MDEKSSGKSDFEPTVEASEQTRRDAPSAGSAVRKVGPYRILRKIGEGGMGEVYLAEQTEPIRRQVAVKVIRKGLDSSRVVARFEAERQALAMMEHSSIARVFDAGATDEGIPFFVMEYVPGVPITQYCDRERLSIEERLSLFVTVCEGVQHAHHKAIIHRDLKPTNILVVFQDGRPVPKIIDFGVAKATSRRLTEKTLFTEHGQLIGTPEYMSPEQADLNNQNIDTRTDVYSLGVLLYELLSGALPFDPKELRSSGFEAIRKKIIDEEPALPSQRLSTILSTSSEPAARRRTEPHTLMRRIRGDLDWIVMRAMEKDRRRRYNSPSELAADIQRHLSDEPVLASPPSLAYRAQKFARRHKTLVASIGVLFAMLAILSASMTYQAYRISAERDRANLEMEVAREVTAFLTDLFRSSDPFVATGEELTVRQLLDRGAERIQASISADPIIKAQLLRTISKAYGNLGQYGQAEALSREATGLLTESLGDGHPDVLEARGTLGSLIWRQGRASEAEPILTEVYRAKTELYGKNHLATADAANNLANLYLTEGRYSEAERLYLEALELRTQLLGSDHPDTLGPAHNLANVYSNLKRVEEAKEIFARVYQGRLRSQGPNHPHTLGAASSLADLLRQSGDYQEAERLYDETLKRRRQVLGDSHPDTLTTLNNLAGLYEDTGRLAEAESLYVETLRTRERVLGADHPQTIISVYNLGNFYFQHERHNEAEPWLLRAIDAWNRTLRPGHPHHQRVRNTLARLCYMKKDFALAEKYFLEELSGWRAASPDDPKVSETLYNLACVASLQNATRRAVAYLKEAADRGMLVEQILTDPDLDSLRREPEYLQIAQRVRERAGER